jgi:hypothetical protein
VLSDTGGYQLIVGQLTGGDRLGFSGQASGTGTGLVFFDNSQTSYRPGIYDGSSHNFKISGTAISTITSTGLGIGTTSPAAKLHVVAPSVTTPSLTWNTTAGQILRNENLELAIGRDANAPYRLWMQVRGSDNTANDLVINPLGGNVGIGTTSPAYKLHLSGGSDTRIQIDATSTQGFYFTKAGVNNGTYRVDSSGNFEWYTKSVSQAMTLTAAGNLLVGTTTQINGGILNVLGTATSTPLVNFQSNVAGDVGQAVLSFAKYDNNTTTSQVWLRAGIHSTGAGCGQINSNGANALAFGTFSDARLKENIVNLPPQLENIMALRPVEFDYIKSEGGGHQIGFVAQEIEAVYADAVGDRGDGMKTVSGWSKTEARLVKALQELNSNLVAELQNLRQRVAAIESK